MDLSRYKRIMQYFWNQEPTNTECSELPVWCLGRQYDPHSNNLYPDMAKKQASDQKTPQAVVPAQISDETVESHSLPSSASAQGGDDCGWPPAFLDDFESRLRFSYRSSFPAIPKSQDPNAASSISLTVRLRSQLNDQGGFTSDTGWGCMIRTGQSLLANAMQILTLSRGKLVSKRPFCV